MIGHGQIVPPDVTASTIVSCSPPADLLEFTYAATDARSQRPPSTAVAAARTPAMAARLGRRPDAMFYGAGAADWLRL
jgi:hypothetical protein